MGYTAGFKWTTELIAKNILACKQALKIERMPTREEIRNFFGDDRLTNKISKTLGYYGWAEQLGLPMKPSETQTGKLGESYIADWIAQKGHAVQRMTTRHPYDLLVDGVVKVDVKNVSFVQRRCRKFLLV